MSSSVENMSVEGPDDVHEAFFVRTLAAAGFHVSTEPSELNHTSADAVVARVRLERTLRGDEEAQARFLKGLEVHVASNQNFLKFLRSTLQSALSSQGNLENQYSISQSHDSLCRLLLTLEMFQSEVATLVLHRLPELSHEEQSEVTYYAINDSTSISRLILVQMRWLDIVFDSVKLIKLLFEVLPVCPFNVQREIVGAIPEIIDTLHHSKVVDQLVSAMTDDKSLLIPILDTLSHLSLPEEVVHSIADKLVERLSSTAMHELPVLLRFLLHTATKDNAKELLGSIRESLQFLGADPLSSSEREEKRLSKKAEVDDGPALVIDSLRQALQFNPLLIKTFLKEIIPHLALEPGEELKVLDIWLLILIFGYTQSSKPALGALKQEIRRGVVPIHLVRRVIRSQVNVTEAIVAPMLKLAEKFLQSQQTAILEFAKEVYYHSFIAISDFSRRQEIIRRLITHIGSGLQEETTAALDVLDQLVRGRHSTDDRAPRKRLVEPFISHLKGLLDYLSSFRLSEVRKTFNIFSVLALQARSYSVVEGTGDEESKSSSSLKYREQESDLDSYMRILIRKLLSSPKFSDQQVGLIGGLCLLTELAPAPLDEASSAVVDDSDSSTAVQRLRLKDAICLLEDLFQRSQLDVRSMSSLFEELADLVELKQLHPNVVNWIHEEKCTDFEDLHILDISQGELQEEIALSKKSVLKPEVWFNLDHDDAAVAINIFPRLFSNPKKRRSLHRLCPEFRLLHCIVSARNGDLSAVDALLGCQSFCLVHPLSFF